MEITALCLRLVMNVLMLLIAHVQRGYAQTSDPVLLSVVPFRLQHFEYEPVSFNCLAFDGSSGWRVMRKINTTRKNCASNWETSKETTCIIKTTYTSDSGEYWCENGKGKKSSAVNIAFTDGAVILETPVLPVMEGSDVTLRCKTKMTPSNLNAYFYKDDAPVNIDSAGEMTIYSVSKSDEGLYKCSMSDSGKSPESWLAVRGLQEMTHVSSHCSTSHIHIIWSTVTVSVAVLLAVGLFHLCKHRGASGENQTSATYAVVTDHRNNKKASEANQTTATYAVVTDHRNNKKASGTNQTTATYALVTNPRGRVPELPRRTHTAYN